MVPVRIFVAVYDALGLFVFFVVDVFSNGSGCGGDESQRLRAGLIAVGNDVVQRSAVFPLMDLVHHGPVDIQAVERVAVRGQRLEYAVVIIAVHLADQTARPFAQRR